MINLVAVMLALTATLAYVNARWLRLPSAIGLLLTALLSSLLLKGFAVLGAVDLGPVIRIVEDVDFADTLLEGMLGLLLFAAALHVDWIILRTQRAPVLLLASVGTVLCAVLVAGGLMVAGPWLLGQEVPLLWALTFGVLIAPTDPIAVGALLKSAGVPADLQKTITGESLFNDGIGVVLFLMALGALTTGQVPDAGAMVRLAVVEVGGGLLFGGVLGALAVGLLRHIDDYQVEIMVTLALVFGGFALARQLHVSGVLAMVILGLVVGHRGRAVALSERTQVRLDQFWELIDEFLNAALFVLIGVEILVLDFSAQSLALGALLVPIVLGARWLSVYGSVAPLRRRLGWPAGGIGVIAWAGVRGGISIALALALPPHPLRTSLLAAAYVIVCFSILGQGLTVERVAKRLLGPGAAGG
jgi:CPA1 family monovalent cation:H+ antiporter